MRMNQQAATISKAIPHMLDWTPKCIWPPCEVLINIAFSVAVCILSGKILLCLKQNRATGYTNACNVVIL